MSKRHWLKLLGAIAILGLGWHFGLIGPGGILWGPGGAGAASPARETPRPIPAGAMHGFGKVCRLLPEDTRGVRHQKFLVRTPEGRSLMIVHNIDLAPRIGDVELGDEVEFCGEFIDNERGGLVHWTHHDPAGRHAAGWIWHNGRVYE